MLARFSHVLFGAVLAALTASLPTVSRAETDAPVPPEAFNSTEPTREGEPSTSGEDLDRLLDMAHEDIGQLTKVSVASPAMAMEVSTVARQSSTVGRSPAAVFVITNEMIRRSGAMCIPELLRMAPGVQVARIDASKWAVTIRGFNGRFANKLLVQIDGRSVYTPLFGGVWWDVQDVVLEDVERIEVIRGPGATVWGANAVNGIINIITKKAADTQGTYVQGGSGTEERGFATARYGGQIGKDLHYRLYGKWFERDESVAPASEAHDDWRMGRGGIRADWTPNCCDTLTLQGDSYEGTTGRRQLYPSSTPPDFARIVDDDARVQGGNALFRWRRKLSDDSDWSVQTYYDRTERHWLDADFREDRDTFDLDFQHRFPLRCRHSIIWGFGYRNTKDKIRESRFRVGTEPVISVSPNERADDLFSYFVQDEITLREDLLYFTAGSKFEHNDYTGFEFQPTGRLLWTPGPRHSVWASISRAVRTPSRVEDDASVLFLPVAVPNPFPPPDTIPVVPQLLGSRLMVAEEVIAYEAGIRVQPTDRFFWDLAVFFNQYENLRSASTDAMPIPGMPPIQRSVFTNDHRARTYGFELASTFELAPWWRLYGAYTLLVVPGNTGAEMGDPRNVAYIQSSWDLGPRVDLDVAWRYVDSLEGVDLLGAMVIPSYNAMDARLAWHCRPGLELAVVGRHLLDPSHLEAPRDFFGNVNTEVQSEVFGTITWRR